MRISDWSSDVCSSDLPVHEFDPVAERIFGEEAVAAVDDAVVVGRMARRLDPRAQRVESLERERDMRLFRRTKIRLCTEVKLAVAEREPAAAAHRHVGGLEIGRASCRERGCRYV